MREDQEKDENFDLTILPVKKDNHGIRIRRPIHPILPDVHKGANMIIVSSVRSGKSNLLVNLMMNSNFLKDAFDDVYIFSSTIHQDQTSRKLRDAFPASSYDHFDENKLMRILDHQKQFEDEDRPSIAIILDDITTLKPKSPFFNLATNFRHHGIGLLVYTVQNFKMIPPVVRSNATNLLIGTLNSQQMKQVAEEYGDNYGGPDNFIRQHRIAVPERFNFLYGRLDQYPAKLHRNFDTKVLYEDNE
tara:strand:- start:1007 stop:1744 length:738 start_codon:yes stop_codon:yes gene_type:complete